MQEDEPLTLHTTDVNGEARHASHYALIYTWSFYAVHHTATARVTAAGRLLNFKLDNKNVTILELQL
jgi:hypothetical protein